MHARGRLESFCSYFWELWAKDRSHTESGRSFVRDRCSARFQTTSSARLFSSSACDLRTSWFLLRLREFLPSLRWGGRVSTSHAASTPRFGGVAKARGKLSLDRRGMSFSASCAQGQGSTTTRLHIGPAEDALGSTVTSRMQTSQTRSLLQK
jgi:hypothetical protein